MKPNKHKGKNRKVDRGFYKPKSYRFSEETHNKIRELAKNLGSQEKAMKYLLSLISKK